MNFSLAPKKGLKKGTKKPKILSWNAFGEEPSPSSAPPPSLDTSSPSLSLSPNAELTPPSSSSLSLSQKTELVDAFLLSLPRDVREAGSVVIGVDNGKMEVEEKKQEEEEEDEVCVCICVLCFLSLSLS